MFISSVLLSEKSFFLKLNSIKKVLFSLTFLLILFSEKAVSNVNHEYCVSKTKPIETIKNNQYLYKDKEYTFKPENINITTTSNK